MAVEELIRVRRSGDFHDRCGFFPVSALRAAVRSGILLAFFFRAIEARELLRRQGMLTFAPVDAHNGSRERTDLVRVIRAEYREMPGLSLTLEQAAKLWHADRHQCLEVLEELTREGFLSRVRERYLRSGGERS